MPNATEAESPPMPTEVDVLAAINSLREESKDGFRTVHERLDRINGRVREVEVGQAQFKHIEAEVERNGKNTHHLREQVGVDVGKIHVEMGRLIGEIDVRKEQIANVHTWIKSEEAERKAAHQEVLMRLTTCAVKADVDRAVFEIVGKLEPLIDLYKQGKGVLWMIRIGSTSGLVARGWQVLRMLGVVKGVS
mgnify:CR=1 FL=1